VERFSALIGFVVILGIAIALSNNRRAIRWQTVMWGLTLQILTAIAVLKGELIAQKLSAIAVPMTRNVAAIVFIVLVIVFTFVLFAQK
jgi:nucleoside permease NupC